MSFLNSIPIDALEMGGSARYFQTVTDADIKEFADMSGDGNPVHLDEKCAEGSRFKKRIHMD